MPRYFFNVNDGSALDGEGVELGSLKHAQCEAVKTAGALIGDSSEFFWDTREFNMTVTNAQGLTLFSLTFFGTEAAAIAYPRRG